MNPLQNSEVFRAIDPDQVNNGDPESRVIDVSDAAYVEYEIQLGQTDIALTELKVQEADAKTDDTTLDTPEDLVDWSASKTDPAADDDDNVYVIGIDLTRSGPRKRYQQLKVTVGNGSVGAFVAAVARVVRSGVRGTDAADRGDAAAVLYA